MAAKTARISYARMIATVSLVACALIPSALAEKQPTYDKRIEEAAIRMLLPKLGDIRGALDLDVEGYVFPPLNERAVRQNAADGPAQLLRKGDQGSILRY
jgi:hypothetical protein